MALDIKDVSSSGTLVWPTINLYPRPPDQDVGRKNRGSRAKRDHQGQAPEAGQMVQPWDALESDQRLLQGAQVGWGGLMSWSSQVELERDVDLERCDGTVGISKGQDLR